MLNSPKRSKEEIRNRLLAFVSDFQRAANFSDHEMADHLRLSRRSYRATILSGRLCGAADFGSFLSKVNVSFDRAVEGNVDFECALAHLGGDRTQIPKMYTRNALSQKRSSIYMLDFIRKRFGLFWQQKIMRDLQIHPDGLQNPSERVGLLLNHRLCHAIKNLSGARQSVKEMGQNFYFKHKDSKLGRELSQYRKTSVVFEYAVSEIIENYVEQNFLWTISSLHQGRCILVGRPNPVNERYLCSPSFEDSPMTELRRGFLECIPMFVGESQCRVEVKECFQETKDKEVFEISF